MWQEQLTQPLIIQVSIYYLDSGGAPEGVIAAVALKCLGGELQGKLLPQSDEEVERCKKMGVDIQEHC